MSGASPSRGKKWAIGMGGFIGLLVWIFDYDFFLNAGGPATPVSNAILKAFHLQALGYPFLLLVPLLVLVAGGAGIGAVAAQLIHRPSD
jgi:hypothetical protein